MLNNSPGLLTIDLHALVANWRELARRAAPGECAAVIKADAYGIGIEVAAPSLQAAGCRTFFVAHVGEGVRARAALGPVARIYVLNGLEASRSLGEYLEHALRPVIGSAQEHARWAERSSPCALHVDTGMRRLGFASLAELQASVERHGLAGADLLMSHFVSAEAADDPLNAIQIARFAAARAAFPELPTSLTNSSGLFLPEAANYDVARPGFALYGGNPTPGRDNPMQPVVTLEIAIQQTRWLERGETCGYNGLWTAPRRARIATLLCGYADGLPIGACATDRREGAFALIDGRRCPLVGRMSMDLCLVDVTDVPEASTAAGCRAQLFGPETMLDDFAARSGTIGYQLLTGLGQRYARRVIA